MVISHHSFPISTPIPCSDDPSSFSIHWIVLDTHTSDDVPNFLMFADVVLPTNTTKFGVYGKAKNFVIPKNPTIIGAKTSDCEVYMLDTLKQAEKKKEGCDHELRLRGHDKKGYGLSWNPFKQGYLISGSYDHKLCLWDVSAVKTKCLNNNFDDKHHSKKADEAKQLRRKQTKKSRRKLSIEKQTEAKEEKQTDAK